MSQKNWIVNYKENLSNIVRELKIMWGKFLLRWKCYKFLDL